MDAFEVVVGAGCLRSDDRREVRFPHRWTPEGVTVESDFTGAHLLHLAAAGCVLNDVYREAVGFGIPVEGVRVTASGGFDTEAWTSTGIAHHVEVRSPAPAEELARLLSRVDEVAEIPRAIRPERRYTGADVRRRAASRPLSEAGPSVTGTGGTLIFTLRPVSTGPLMVLVELWKAWELPRPPCLPSRRSPASRSSAPMPDGSRAY